MGVGGSAAVGSWRAALPLWPAARELYSSSNDAAAQASIVSLS